MDSERHPLGIAWDVWCVKRATAAAITARQQRRLHDLIAFARARSSYYRELYRDLPATIDDQRQLPPVTKPALMARFDEWVTDPAVTLAGVQAFVADPSLIGARYLDRYMVWTTSGSTGVPAILVHDPGALAVYTALSTARGALDWVKPRDLWRIMRQGGRGASILATGGHFAGTTLLEQRRRRFRSRAKRLRMLSVLTPLPDLVAELNEFQPAIVGGYPSVFALLAQEQQAGRLHIQPVLLTAGGETLTPAQRARISAAFGNVLHNSYGASEAIAITLECPHGWLHVNADWFILEPVDREYRPTPPGQTSDSVLLTNLANHVQPIIRYELGDRVLVKPEPCACGSPLPAIQVEGRTDETLRLTTPDGGAIDLLPLALGTVVEETAGVYRFQVIQRGPARLCVRLDVAPDSDRMEVWAAVAGRLQHYLAKHGLPELAIELDDTPPIPHPISGKLRQVWAEPVDSAAD